jgi:predicted MarR family transcription regulator
LSSKTNNEIARYKSGSGDDAAVDQRIALAWERLVNEQRDEVAAALGTPASSLDPKHPPFRAETQAGGISGVEVAILFAGAALSGFVKDLGSAAGKAAATKLRQVWSRYMEKKVRDPKNPTLGDRIDKDG